MVLGSNGETPFLSRSEKVALVEHVVNYCRSEQPNALVIAGSGVES